MNSIGIYIHIPFCRKRCLYCDFLSYTIDEHVPESFINALCREICLFEGPDRAHTIFIGGGTPSLLTGNSLGKILESLKERFSFDSSPEITIEANPDDIRSNLVAEWIDLGVDRLSLGVQSFNDDVLAYLGRRHNAETARKACEIAGEHFNNWSMDLIFGAHPISAWPDTLKECIAFKPTHVSAYGLTYEENTPFGKRKSEAIDDDVSLGLYRQVRSTLEAAGFDQYEISNFAQESFQCQHNLIYWQNKEYAGFGPGAFSYINGIRSRNTESIKEYLESPEMKIESLSLTSKEIRTETLIQHFRLKCGLNKAEYMLRFGRTPRDDFAIELEDLIKRGLLEENETFIYPTTKGIELNNEIGLVLVDS